MRVEIKHWHAVAQWRWDTGVSSDDPNKGDDDEGDVCGICRVPFEGCCPSCKVPGDDCPLIWGECSHVFHMHCLLKWVETSSSKQQCPMDRRTWVTAERKVGGSANHTNNATASTSSASNPVAGLPTAPPPVIATHPALGS